MEVCALICAIRFPSWMGCLLFTHANYLRQKIKSHKLITFYTNPYGNQNLENQKLKHVLWCCSDRYPIMWNVHNLAWGNPTAHINVIIHIHIVLLFLLHSVWYGRKHHDETVHFLNSILCDVVSIFLHYKMFFQTCVSSLYIQNDFYIKIGHYLEKLW